MFNFLLPQFYHSEAIETTTGYYSMILLQIKPKHLVIPKKFMWLYQTDFWRGNWLHTLESWPFKGNFKKPKPTRDVQTDVHFFRSPLHWHNLFQGEWHHDHDCIWISPSCFRKQKSGFSPTVEKKEHMSVKHMETGAFEEHLLCPVCREIFRDPVLLLCSHSFCLACLEQYWVHSSSQMCPVCRTEFCMEHPPCNRVLKNLCEVVLQEKEVSEDVQELFCSLHGEKLELFCLEDRRLVCGVCMNDDVHITHTCRPVEETAETLKVHFILI